MHDILTLASHTFITRLGPKIISITYLSLIMFIEALFTTVEIWKQPKCPPIDEWIKKWYIYTMEYYSAIKKN